MANVLYEYSNKHFANNSSRYVTYYKRTKRTSKNDCWSINSLSIPQRLHIRSKEIIHSSSITLIPCRTIRRWIIEPLLRNAHLRTESLLSERSRGLYHRGFMKKSALPGCLDFLCYLINKVNSWEINRWLTIQMCCTAMQYLCLHTVFILSRKAPIYYIPRIPCTVH